jgi:hypothetical protein
MDYDPEKFRSGAALVLSVLILWMLLAIALGIAAIFIGELKISGDVDASVTALYAADSGTECFLFENRLIRTAACGVLATAICDPALVPDAALLNAAVYGKVKETKTGTFCELQTTGTFQGSNRGLEVRYGE